MSTDKESLKDNDLVLGFTVNQYLVPGYWNRGEVNDCKVSDIIRVPGDSIGCHTAIVAQSGSGKSFFLGRLIEEIVLRTKARCLIFDPNGDFRKIRDVVGENAALWKPKDNRKEGPGMLTHEKTQKEFENKWNQIDMQIQTQMGFQENHCKKIGISWTSFTMDMLTEELDPIMRPDLIHCHDFVKNLNQLMAVQRGIQPKTSYVLDTAKSYLSLKENQGIAQLKKTLEDNLKTNIDNLTPNIRRELIEIYYDVEDIPISLLKDIPDGLKKTIESNPKGMIRDLFDDLARTAEFVSKDVAQFYFSKAASLKGIIEEEMTNNDTNLVDKLRLDVIDLQSLGERQERLISVNAIIEAEWNKARVAHKAAQNYRKLDDWSLNIMSATDEPDKQKQIDGFKNEREKNTLTVLIVAIDTDKPKVWTIAMFNDERGLIEEQLIDDGNHKLAIELNKEERGGNRIIELAALYLGRSILDYRVPTFIVVDEAHNLIPSSPRDKAAEAVRNNFRTIVAEGRKYGLFLILVSQRPDKLDAQVFSECENKAIMKLSTGTVLARTREILGLDDVPQKMMEKCLEFELGRALLVGPWTKETPQFMYCAARRTEEGGKSLRKEHWASPYTNGGGEI